MEVSRFVERFISPWLDYSRQAYSQYRAKLKGEALGLVKDNLASLLLGKESAQQVYDRLLPKIKRRTEAVRRGRSYPKEKKLHFKYPINKRPVL